MGLLTTVISQNLEPCSDSHSLFLYDVPFGSLLASATFKINKIERLLKEESNSASKMPKSTTTTSSHGRATALLLSSTLPLICCGFVQVSTLNAILPRSHSVHVNPSPLFVVQSDIDVNGDPTAYPVIKSIDAKMEKFKKSRDKYQQKLDKFEMGLEVLKSKKMRYLEGIELGQPPKGSNFGETMRRSAVKAMMWRVIAGTVTLITSLKFSGSLATALRIVGSDFFSKVCMPPSYTLGICTR